MYSLVVYLQVANIYPNIDPNWRGQSRILRYELPKYDPNGTLLTRNTGFIDPSYANNLSSWPFQGGVNLQTTTPTGSPVVLVDFVDSPTSTADPNNLLTCDITPSTTVAQPALPAPQIPNQTRVPAAAATNTSFFTCITTITGNTGQDQDVTIYLRGNAYGQPGVTVLAGGTNTVLSPLQTTVTLRGVVDKTPQ